MPCADCEGIETTVIINQDLTFNIKTKYLYKSDDVFEKSSSFTWNRNGTTITLEGSTGSVSQYFVGGNILTQLDVEGNRITRDLAQKYMLKKEPSANISISENSETEISAIGIKWKLLELMGKSAVTKKQKQQRAIFVIRCRWQNGCLCRLQQHNGRL